MYKPNSTLDQTVVVWGNRMRDMLHEGSGESEIHSYINYAHGDESLEAMYGYEPWRLEKLRRLKEEYDPNNVFRYYAPIS